MSDKQTKTNNEEVNFRKEGGRKLAEARHKAKLTQEECANKLGVSVSYYRHLEQGEKSVYRMSGALRLSVKKLLKVSF